MPCREPHSQLSLLERTGLPAHRNAPWFTAPLGSHPAALRHENARKLDCAEGRDRTGDTWFFRSTPHGPSHHYRRADAAHVVTSRLRNRPAETVINITAYAPITRPFCTRSVVPPLANATST